MTSDMHSPAELQTALPPPIDVRYDVERWHLNNGFRRRWLAIGERTAADIEAVRAEAMAAAIREAIAEVTASATDR
jgi:hypothetical protein